MTSIRKNNLLIWLVSMLLVSACQKEDLTVRDIPFEELTASFYVLHENAVEIPTDKHPELIVSKSDHTLALQKDPIFSNLQVGSFIISQMNTPAESFLMRKIKALEDQGSQIILETEHASLIEVMSEYYFNSRFSEIHGFKNNASLNQIGGSQVSELFNIFNQDPASPFTLTPIFSFDGNISFEAIHPHTAYKYFACNNDDKCFQAIDKTDANPQNGYYDVVDRYFDNNLNVDITRNGFYTLSFDNFGIKEIGMEYGTKISTGGPVQISDRDTPEQIYNKIVAATNQSADQPKSTDLNIKYFGTPLTFWGAFTVTIPVSPVIDFDLSAAAYAKLVAVFPNRINLQMGHINWNKTIPSAQVDISITQNGSPVSFNKIFEGGTVNASAAINGQAKMRFGVALGAALSVGEANTAGISFGGMIEAANYYKLEGSLGARFTDILNTRGGGSVDFFGEFCFDKGIEYDFFLFSDANLGPFIGDFFDARLDIPKESFGLKNFSLMQLLQPFSTEKGLCLGITGCDATEVNTLNFGLDIKDDLRLIFNFKNEAFSNELYRLTIKTPQGNVSYSGPYTYETNHTILVDLNNKDKVLSAILNGNVEIEIYDINQECNKTFKSENIGFVVSCDNSPYEQNVFDLGTEVIDIAGNATTYFTERNAKEHCDKLLTRLLPKDLLIERLTDRPCVNPTGFSIELGTGTHYANTNKAYIWIAEDVDGHNILSVDFEFKSGQTTARNFKTERASISVKATAVCAD